MGWVANFMLLSLDPEKENWHSLYRKLCGHEDLSGRVWETCFM